jgi:polysaccharide biosynthesis protein PslH
VRSLVITPTPTHPPHHGNRARINQIAGALRRSGPVEVLYHCREDTDTAALEAMRHAWDALHILPEREWSPQRRVPGHWGLDEWISPALMEAARVLAAVTRYDVVVANYVWYSQLLTAFGDAIRILDTHDRFSDRHDLTRAVGMAPHWFSTTREEEARGLARADIVLAIQADEGAYFRAIASARVEVIEYAIPPVITPRSAAGRIAVGYFGSDNPWNLASITKFDARVARLARCDVDFLVMGGVTRRLPPLEVFQSVGTVVEPGDAYAALDLVVNPMVGGTGLKIKTVEALAHGRAMLSTRDGGAGLETIHPDLRHANLDSLIGRLSALLDAPRQIEELAREMRGRYAAFEADVAARLDALCASLA